MLRVVERLKHIFGLDDTGVVYVGKAVRDNGQTEAPHYFFVRRSSANGEYEIKRQSCTPAQLGDVMPWPDADSVKRLDELPETKRQGIESSLLGLLPSDGKYEIMGLNRCELDNLAGRRYNLQRAKKQLIK